MKPIVYGKFLWSPNLVAPEAMRNLLLIHVLHDRRIGRRAERREQHVDLVALDQLARLLDGLRRAIGVVIGDVLDHAAVDAALLVDHLEIGAGRAADRRIDRGRS
jgi:hypothetical protein